MAIEKREEHFVGRVAQKALITDPEGKLLVVRNLGEEVWDLPGGRLHVDEDPLESLLREIQEEVGIGTDIVRPFDVNVFIRDRGQGAHFSVLYECSSSQSSPDLTLAPDEIEEARWIAEAEMKGLSFYPEYEQSIRKFFQMKNRRG